MIAPPSARRRAPLSRAFARVALLAALATSPAATASSGSAPGEPQSPRPVLRLEGAPAGKLVEVPGVAAKAEVVRFEPALASGLLTVGMEESVVISDFPVAPEKRARWC